MADKEKLRDMLDNLIDDKSEQAQVDFHDFLGGKMKDVLGVEPPVDSEAEVDTDNNEE